MFKSDLRLILRYLSVPLRCHIAMTRILIGLTNLLFCWIAFVTVCTLISFREQALRAEIEHD
jgi:hypothetical protein